MDGNGFLRYSSSRHTMTTAVNNPPLFPMPPLGLPQNPPPVTAPLSIALPSPDATNVDTYVSSAGDETFRLEVPRDMSAALWKKLKNIVEHVLKPEDVDS